jgi:DNA-binding NarL/FixJ family response regulator
VPESEFDVIATAGDGYELVAAAETLTPDVIVSNIALRSERYDSPLVRHRST